MATSGSEPVVGSCWRRWRWVAYAGVAVLFLAGCAFSYYFFYIRPPQRLQAIVRDENTTATAEEIRAICHQVIRFPGERSHSAFIYLEAVGDETSVPLLISAIWWAPAEEKKCCEWAHCLDALEALTNQNFGFDYAKWRAWYNANKHKSRLAWIASGFGVTVQGSPQAVHVPLLRIGSSDPEGPIRRNALKLLKSYDRKLVSEQVSVAAKNGKPDEKLGAIEVAVALKLPGAEAMLQQLGKDADRGVRVLALNHLAKAAADRLTNLPGSYLRSHKLDQLPPVGGAVSIDDMLNVRLNCFAEGSNEPCFDVDAYYYTTMHGTLHKVQRSDGKNLWSTQHTVPPDRRFSYAPICHGDYVVLGEDRVLVCSKADGREIASVPGRLLGVGGGLVFAAVGKTVNIHALPDLKREASFAADGQVVGAAVGRENMALLVTDAALNVHPVTEGRAWLEGWSIKSKTRVWGPVLLSEGGVRDSSGIMQADPDVCYASQGGLTRAIRIANGHILWEAAPEGTLYHVGKVIVLDADGIRGLRIRGLVLLHPRDGHMLARYVRKDGCGYCDVFVNGEQLLGHDCERTVHLYQLPVIPSDTPQP